MRVPAVFLPGGNAAPLLLGPAAVFHLVNARSMALNRFLWAFPAMFPAVLYVTRPRTRSNEDGRNEVRDDTMPRLCVGFAAGAGAAAVAAHRRRGRMIARGHGGEHTLATSSGNVLAYRSTGPQDGPVLILESGLGVPMELWAWIEEEPARRFTTRPPTVRPSAGSRRSRGSQTRRSPRG